jgi:glucuronokinase
VIFTTSSCARAGLIGNPSDGFFGKTIALAISNYTATATIFESPELIIEPSHSDRNSFKDLEDLVDEIRISGYYGGIRLIKASVVRFRRYCRETGIELPERNFTIRYDSDVPMRVGLAGSSAIITAVFRSLCKLYEVPIPHTLLASLVLSVETEELGIPAGLQDRVAQAHQGLVYMDFSRQYMEEYGRGVYQNLDPDLLPPLFVAHSRELCEGTEVTHSDLRTRFEAGDRKIHQAMRSFAELTDNFRLALENGRVGEMHALINRNFDLRASITGISESNWQLVNTARNASASAKFCGSGGAVVGICEDDAVFEQLCKDYAKIGAEIVRPIIAPAEPEPELSPELETESAGD